MGSGAHEIDLKELKRRMPSLLEVVRRHVPDLKRAGQEWEACCPFHNETEPSFRVDPVKELWNCFGCSAEGKTVAGGDVFDFIEQIEGRGFKEVVTRLAEEYGLIESEAVLEQRFLQLVDDGTTATKAYRLVFGDQGVSNATLRRRASRLQKRLKACSNPKSVTNQASHMECDTSHSVTLSQSATPKDVTPLKCDTSHQPDHVTFSESVTCDMSHSVTTPQSVTEKDVTHSKCDTSQQSASPGETDPDKILKRNSAENFWNQTVDDQCPIQDYLAGRSITIDPPAVLRHHQQKNMIVARVADADGNPTGGIHRTFLNPSHPKNKRKLMLGPTKGGSVHLADPVDGVLAVGEGIETCLAFMQATGVPAWAALSTSGLKGLTLPDTVQTLYVLADIDPPHTFQNKLIRPGQDAAKATAETFSKQGIETAIVWPGDPTGNKADFNDLLIEDSSGETIRQQLARVVAMPSPERHVIKTKNGHMHTAMREAEMVLIYRRDEVFQRGGALVRLVRIPTAETRQNIQRQAGSLQIAQVERDWLDLRLSDAVDFKRFDQKKQEWRSVNPPQDIARLMLANAGDWQFKNLAGVIETPTLRPDGSLLEKPGYDNATGLYFDNGGLIYPKVPNNPTKEDAEKALEFLGQVISEFPFEDEANRATALAAILTTLVRRSIRTAPLFGITAPTMGTGKTLFANIAAIMSTGRSAPAITHTVDSTEEKKRLFAMLAEGDAIGLIDNVEQGLQSDALCTILTEDSYKDRILGSTKTITVPTAMTWFTTGNNLQIKGDLSTRTVMVRFNAGVERPDARSFKRNLRTWIPENRAKLVVAGLTILRAYVVAGRPESGLDPFGRFEDWGRWIRDALVWLGLPDACQTRDQVEGDDPVREQLGNLLEAWWGAFEGKPVTLAELVKRTQEMANPPSSHWNDPDSQQEPDPVLLNALLEVAAGQKGTVNPRRLGNFIKKHRDRVESGLVIRKTTNISRTKAAYWVLESSREEGKSAGRGNMQDHSLTPMGKSCKHNVNTIIDTSIGGLGSGSAGPADPANEETAF